MRDEEIDRGRAVRHLAVQITDGTQAILAGVEEAHQLMVYNRVQEGEERIAALEAPLENVPRYGGRNE
jgi:hypothetical protein